MRWEAGVVLVLSAIVMTEGPNLRGGDVGVSIELNVQKAKEQGESHF